MSMFTTILVVVFCCFLSLLLFRYNLYRKFNIIRAEREKKFLVRTRCNVEHTTTTIENIVSEIWKISSKTATTEEDPRLIYVMIPGNPGISSVYVHWMQILVSLFVQQKSNTYDAIDVYVVSHANHFSDSFNHNGKKLFTLDEQIKHKIDCIKFITNKYKHHKKCHYVFAGHSIGAFMVLRILKHFKSLDIKQLHLWAPTIVNLGKSRNGLNAQKMLTHFGFLIPAVQFLMCHILPFWIIKLFVPPSACDTHAIIRGLQCENAQVFMNMLFLAQIEFKQVVGLDRTEMDRLLKEHSRQIVFYWAHNDGWAHAQCRTDIKDLFKKQTDHEMNEIFAYWEVDSDIQHAFIVDDDLSKNVEVKLARKMLDWIHHY